LLIRKKYSDISNPDIFEFMGVGPPPQPVELRQAGSIIAIKT
jgi:hypothetical protein